MPDERGAFTSRVLRTSAQRSHGTSAAGALETRGSDAPGLADRGLSPGQRERLEMRDRSNAARSQRRSSPPQSVPSVP